MLWRQQGANLLPPGSTAHPGKSRQRGSYSSDHETAATLPAAAALAPPAVLLSARVRGVRDDVLARGDGSGSAPLLLDIAADRLLFAVEPTDPREVQIVPGRHVSLVGDMVREQVCAKFLDETLTHSDIRERAPEVVRRQGLARYLADQLHRGAGVLDVAALRARWEHERTFGA